MKIKRTSDGAVFTLTAYDGDGRPVLTPDEFGPPISVSFEELHADYKPATKGERLPVVAPPSEAEILAERDAEANRAINQAYGRAVAGATEPPPPFEPPEGSPEHLLRLLGDHEC